MRSTALSLAPPVWRLRLGAAIARVIVAVPALVLAAAYAAIAGYARTPWPWASTVHEDGARSLLATVFYFEHAVRELGPDLMVGWTIGAAFSAFRPAPADVRVRVARQSGVALAIGITVIVAGALATVGPALTLENLAQMPIRPGGPVSFGSHWHYHFLSTIALMLLAFGVIGLTETGTARHTAAYRRAWLAFAILSVVFIPRAEVFTDAKWLGHQARELLTHALVTLPLAVAAVRRCARGVVPGPGGESPASLSTPVLGALAAAMAVGVGLGIGVVVTHAAGAGQTHHVVPLVATHVFEHTLGYVLVPLVACWAWARCEARA